MTLVFRLVAYSGYWFRIRGPFSILFCSSTVCALITLSRDLSLGYTGISLQDGARDSIDVGISHCTLSGIPEVMPFVLKLKKNINIFRRQSYALM